MPRVKTTRASSWPAPPSEASSASDAPKPAKRSRSQVTVKEKLAVIGWYHQNGRNQEKTAEHFRNVEGFHTFSQSTVSRWLKEEENLRKQYEGGSRQRIRTVPVKHPALEEYLSAWIEHTQQQQAMRVTGDQIKAAASQFYDERGTPQEERLNLSNGWLGKFKQRHQLRQVRSYSEAGTSASFADATTDTAHVTSIPAAVIPEQSPRKRNDVRNVLNPSDEIPPVSNNSRQTTRKITKRSKKVQRPTRSQTRTPVRSERAMAAIEDDEIKEWHFHVYWLENGSDHGFAKADALRLKLLERVEKDPKFIAVFHGVSSAQYTGLTTAPPPMNRKPVGPHPSGSFEVWVPNESFVKVLSFFTLHRGSLSIFLHALTKDQRIDHSPARAIWLGSPWPIETDALPEDPVEEDTHPPFQYPELGLGYSADF
ncbi:Dopa 4,5-dioxygenase, partial [Globisporangium splendens]